MQISIWHWAILLLLIGVPVFFAVRSAARPLQDTSALVGFGGWLMLLAIGQCLAPFRTLAELFSSSDGYRHLMTLPNGALAAYGEIALLLVFLVLQVIVFVAMLRRSSRFKQLFLYQWFAIPIVFILDTVWISAVMSAPVSLVLAGGAPVMPAVSFVLTGIWVAYVYKSVRVRNTFDRGRDIRSGRECFIELAASAVYGCRQKCRAPSIDPDHPAVRPARARISGAGVTCPCGLQ